MKDVLSLGEGEIVRHPANDTIYLRVEHKGPARSQVDMTRLTLQDALRYAWNQGYLCADNGGSEEENPYMHKG